MRLVDHIVASSNKSSVERIKLNSQQQINHKKMAKKEVYSGNKPTNKPNEEE